MKDLNNRILRAINKGLNEALSRFSFDDIEDFDNDDITMQSNDVNQKDLLQNALNYIKCKELDELYAKGGLNKKFITTCITYHNKYNVLFNPHLDNMPFRDFIYNVIRKFKADGNLDLNWIDTSEVTNMNNLFDINDYNESSKSVSDRIRDILKYISDFTFIKDWNTSNVVNMRGIFSSGMEWYDNIYENIKSLHGLENWDVSNVKNLGYAFYNFTSLEDISALLNWDTSNVTRLDGIFGYCSNLQSLHGLENWDVSNVTDMRLTFYKCQKLSDISALAKWNMSSASDLYLMFNDCISLVNISSLANWKFSNDKEVTLRDMFNNCGIKDATPLANWDMTNVEEADGMFRNCKYLENITALAKWNMSNVKYIDNIFSKCPYLDDTYVLNIIKTWDISAAIKNNRYSPYKEWLYNESHPDTVMDSFGRITYKKA